MTRARQNFSRRTRGAAMLAALCFATVLAIAVGSYITVCFRTLEMSSRAAHSSRSVELAELGMEDTLWAMNKADWSTWTIRGTTASKTISGFSFGSGVTGSVSMSVTNYNVTTGSRAVAVTGTTTLANGTTISRSLSGSGARAPLFLNALAATTGSVKLTAAGTSTVIDSYNSSLGTYASQTPTYAAILSSGSTSTAAATVQLTNAQVKGYVATLSTGPSYSTSAKLVGPSTDPTVRIDTSRISTSPYQPIYDISAVAGGTIIGNPALDTTTTLGTAGATTASVYTSTGIDMRGTTRLVINGPVKLVVSGTFYVGLYGGTPSIDVTANGTLEVISSGDVAIYGGGINNASQIPGRVAIYSSNALTVPDMNTTTPFYGVIYMPNGDFKVWSNTAIYGAIVARNVTFSGTAPVVHYDLNLRNTVFSGVDTPYAISDWRETTTEI
jgi:hypothetical protein